MVTRLDQDAPVFRTADPLFASDHELRVVLWNEAAEALVGYRAEEVLGKRCFEVLGCKRTWTGVDCHANCAGLPRKLRQELAPAHERSIRAKSSEIIPVSVTTILVPSRTREHAVLVHLLRDLRRQKEIEALLRSVAAGAAKLACGDGEPGPSSAPGPGSGAAITGREREVLRLLAQGTSTETIAARLGIGHRTARNHIQNLLSKLQVHSRLEAVSYALTHGLL